MTENSAVFFFVSTVLNFASTVLNFASTVFFFVSTVLNFASTVFFIVSIVLNHPQGGVRSYVTVATPPPPNSMHPCIPDYTVHVVVGGGGRKSPSNKPHTRTPNNRQQGGKPEIWGRTPPPHPPPPLSWIRRQHQSASLLRNLNPTTQLLYRERRWGGGRDWDRNNRKIEHARRGWKKNRIKGTVTKRSTTFMSLNITSLNVRVSKRKSSKT